ncbi:Nitrogen permease regulator 2 [Serendipita sp. 397]|nr:Nitrogen permease regulator 2 [Serendipita sp. 397]
MHIASLFYAIFHPEKGPRIIFQVPENLITTSTAKISTPEPDTPNGDTKDAPPMPSDTRKKANTESGHPPGNQSTPRESLNSSTSSRLSTSKFPAPSRPGKPSTSPNRSTTTTSGATSPTLFEWELVSQFVIPRLDVCGRLTIFTTRKHRIVGFPVLIWDEGKYDRGFQFNVCFVFLKEVDVSCYEPVVRKLARVLTACEIDHSFLTSPTTEYRMYPILEQLFADLNSYSETSIRIDRYNSIELRIFPHYPNPPIINSWDVPVPLIDITKRVEPNWDLTMRKVVPFINGVDHVKKIAQKAEADIDLVKECMAQVMMYQCVMMVDIFQFSNIYTLCRPVMWLFADPAIYEECGPYIHKGEGEIPPWPRLAWWYARLKAPLTVGKWINQYDIDLEQIDVRRFITFGIIKGFLRRVHRWPIHLKDDKAPLPHSYTTMKRRNRSIATSFLGKKSIGNEPELQPSNFSFHSVISEPPPGLGSAITQDSNSNNQPDTTPLPLPKGPGLTVPHEDVDTEKFAAAIARRFPGGEPKPTVKRTPMGGISASIPNSYVSASVLKSRFGDGNASSVDESEDMKDPTALSLPIAQELAEQVYNQGQAVAKMKGATNAGGMAVEIPPDLNMLLDGTHHSDELCVHFGFSWSVLQATLRVVGGGSGDDEDLGRVVILLR